MYISDWYVFYISTYASYIYNFNPTRTNFYTLESDIVPLENAYVYVCTYTDTCCMTPKKHFEIVKERLPPMTAGQESSPSLDLIGSRW